MSGIADDADSVRPVEPYPRVTPLPGQGGAPQQPPQGRKPGSGSRASSGQAASGQGVRPEPQGPRGGHVDELA